MLRLKEARKAKRLTQVEVARIIGISQNGYSNWETGRNAIDAKSLKKLAELFDVSVDYLMGNDEPASQRTTVRVPVLGDIAAGIPIDAITDILDMEDVDERLTSLGELFALRIKGDSMEPRIKDGDVVICVQQDDCNTGDTAVIMINGGSATLKRIKKEAGGIWLIPNNPAYDSVFYSNEDIQTIPVRVIGRVVELRGKF